MDPADRMKILLAQYQGNNQGLQKECTKWRLEDECWNDLRPYAFPDKPPVVADYEKLSKDQRKEIEVFAYLADIEPVYAERLHVFGRNKARLEWLEKHYEYCETEEECAKWKIKMARFKETVAEQEQIMPKPWGKGVIQILEI